MSERYSFIGAEKACSGFPVRRGCMLLKVSPSELGAEGGERAARREPAPLSGSGAPNTPRPLPPLPTWLTAVAMPHRDADASPMGSVKRRAQLTATVVRKESRRPPHALSHRAPMRRMQQAPHHRKRLKHTDSGRFRAQRSG